MQQNGAVYRSYRDVCGVSPCTGISFSGSAGRLLCGGKSTLYGTSVLPADPDRITIIGDSAGGNLAAAVCLKARDTGEFIPKKQILIYPALNNCYTEGSPYKSVQENGEGYLLTAVKMEDYLKLYESSPEDRQNPYFAPILEKDLSHMPETLILTAEFDPLRMKAKSMGNV